MRIGVIGTGNIGGTIGEALARAGHQVTLGSRRPDDAGSRPDDAGSASGARVADLAGAIADAEVVLLALPAGGLAEFLAEHGDSLGGKLVVDATNRIGAPVANAAEQIAAGAPAARYARAFNTLGWENFADPEFDGLPADLFFSCAEQDRPVVEELITGVGLRPAYLGEGRQNVVDGVLPLWFALVQAGGGNRHLAFRVLRK